MAQWLERFLDMEEVTGSIPVLPTSKIFLILQLYEKEREMNIKLFYAEKKPFLKYWLMTILPGIFPYEFRLSLESPEYVIALTEFFSRARRYVFLSAGDCCHLSDPAVIEAAKSAMNKGVVINVIKDDTVCALSSVDYPITTVSRRLTRHFVVNDRWMTAVHAVGETTETVSLGNPVISNKFVNYSQSLLRN